MKYSFSLFYILFFVQMSKAQGIRVNSPNELSTTSLLSKFPSQRFTDLFETDSLIELYDTRPYVQKKVKRIEVRNVGGELAYFAELNHKGQIISVGNKCKGGYFMISDSFTFLNKERRVINRYYNHKKLVRLDTINIVPKFDRHADTLIQYNFANCKSYKSGWLLITRNDYYNEKYYNKMLLMKPKHEIKIGESNEKEEAKIYLEKKLSTQFQLDSMYLVSLKTAVVDARLFNEKANQYLISEDAKMIAKNLGKDTVVYFDEGESFNEPVDWNTPFYCGNVFQSRYNADYHYKFGKNGLVDNYYQNSSFYVDGRLHNSKGDILYRFYYRFFK